MILEQVFSTESVRAGLKFFVQVLCNSTLNDDISHIT